MKLKRKIYKKLLEWKNEYESYLLIDFAKKDKEVEVYFERYLNDLDTFFLLLQTHFGKKLTDRKSLIIFDEVQMFPIEVKSGKLYYSSKKFDCERWNYLYSPIYDDEYIEI